MVEPAPGRFSMTTDWPKRSPFATKTSVDEAAIITACGGLPLAGNEEGRVDAFGVSLTRHFSSCSLRPMSSIGELGEVCR